MLSKQEIQDIVNKYASCMQEIKNRTEAITSIYKKRCSTLYSITNTEFVALQFRKIFELIALANLVANKDEYEKVRACFQTDWNGKGIIKTLRKINPNYFPEGVIRKDSKDPKCKCEWQAKKEGVLTEVLYENAYDRTSCILHAKNPFNTDNESIDTLNRELLCYINLIVNLLNEHTVTLCNDDKINCLMSGVTQLGNNEKPKVSVNYFQKIEQ